MQVHPGAHLASNCTGVARTLGIVSTWGRFFIRRHALQQEAPGTGGSRSQIAPAQEVVANAVLEHARFRSRQHSRLDSAAARGKLLYRG